MARPIRPSPRIPEPLTRHLGGEWQSAGFPASGAHEAVAQGEAPRCGEHQPDCDIGHVVREHVRRGGHANAAAAAQGEIHRIRAHAVDGDDLQRRQGFDQGGTGALGATRGDAADAGPLLGRDAAASAPLTTR